MLYTLVIKMWIYFLLNNYTSPFSDNTLSIIVLFIHRCLDFFCIIFYFHVHFIIFSFYFNVHNHAFSRVFIFSLKNMKPYKQLYLHLLQCAPIRQYIMQKRNNSLYSGPYDFTRRKINVYLPVGRKGASYVSNKIIMSERDLCGQFF